MQQELYEEWLKGDDAKATVPKVQAKTGKRYALAPAQGKAESNHSDFASRMMKSYYRRAVAREWGSTEWMHTVIALGRIPDAFVEIIRRKCDERQALAPAQGKPRQMPRAHRERE